MYTHPSKNLNGFGLINLAIGLDLPNFYNYRYTYLEK